MPGAYALQQEKPLQWEAQASQLVSSPHLLQLENLCEAMKIQQSQIMNKNFLKVYIKRQKTITNHHTEEELSQGTDTNQM